MMHDIPMLADFGVRLAFGLAVLLLLTSWRSVPLPFFRTHSLVIMGLLVLSALDVSRTDLHGAGFWLIVAGAIGTYLASVTWGLGLPRVAQPLTFLIAVLGASWLALASYATVPGVWVFNAASRLASGFLLGATLTAMLLGHHYLTAPAMSIEPLKRFVRCIGWGLGVRGLIAGAGLLMACLGLGGFQAGSLSLGFDSPLLLLMRWGMGFAGPALAAFLAWKTVEIRSTQSATGILYVAMTLLLFGELSSLIGARAGGLIG
jgi:hypothetical protein